MSLTKHPQGSLRELWTLSFPLMLSSLSLMMMLFVDRLMLARFSSEALTAAVSASTFGWSFIFAFTVIGGIAEVFVAQYNGAGLKKKFGEPVWQMLWFSLFTAFVFIPFGFFGAQFVFPNQPLEYGYLKWMMIFGPSYPIYAALCGFFIGQGKTKMVTYLAFIANFINAGMDYVLIYGIEGITPSYGVEGAAIATSGSSIFQVIVLTLCFLSKQNRLEHNTGDWKFRWNAFKQCCKIGLPGGLFCGCEICGWAIYYWMLASVSPQHLVVASITQSFALLCYFFAEGVSKGAATIAGNLIGAGQIALVSKVFQNGLKLVVLFSGALLVIYLIADDLLVNAFLDSARTEARWDSSLESSLRTCLLLSIGYMLFEGIRLLLTGLLTAAGDTRFLLLSGATNTWVFLVLPVYLLVVRTSSTIVFAATICLVYSAIAALSYFLRFQMGRWRKHALLTETGF